MVKALFAGLLVSLLVLAGCAGKGGPSGSATASADGFGGEVTVTVTMENGKITKVDADGPDETPGIGTRALMELPKQIVEENSTEINAVAAATVTSDAVLKAAKAAKDQIK